MPNDTAAANALLSQIEVGTDETPDQLRQRALALDAEFALAVAAPMRLSMESARLRARATAVENALKAEVPVAEAETAVAAAEDAYAATAEPAAEAAKDAEVARQRFEVARDELFQAQKDGCDWATEAELETAATVAARIDERRVEVAARTRQAREDAKRALDMARNALARARRDLETARAAIDAPLEKADRPLGERFAALMYIWPLRVALRNEDGYALDAIDLALCRTLCQEVADALDVVPPRLARQIAQEAAQEATRAIRGTQISVPAGQGLNTTLGALAGLPVQR